MRNFVRSVLAALKPKTSMPKSSPQPAGDGSNKERDGTQADVVFHVPGMS
jgi:hypothetical protein